MMLGGGGSPAPLAEMAVQLMIGMLFCLWLVWFPKVPASRLRLSLTLGGLLLLVPVVQLVPLPASLWHALPGREIERASLDLIGRGDSWRPLSMAPARTLNSLLALVPPATVLLFTGTLGPAGRSMVVGMIAGVSLLAILVGTVQSAGGEGNLLRFYVPDAGYMNGFQANHNSAADVLLIGMVALAVAVQDWLELGRQRAAGLGPSAALLTGVALMSIGVVLTASRAGTALLPVAWLGVALASRPRLRFPARQWAMGAAALAAAIGAGLFLLRHNAVVTGLVSRYDFSRELRPQIWVDSLSAAQAYFPVGAGMGAFLPVFLAAERLDAVFPAVPNRAHNDYLELAIEAGLLGFAVIAVIMGIFTRLAIKQMRHSSRRLRRHAIFAITTFTIIALHSQVDYPLRSMSLACIAAVSGGLLVPVARGARGADVPIEN